MHIRLSAAGLLLAGTVLGQDAASSAGTSLFNQIITVFHFIEAPNSAQLIAQGSSTLLPTLVSIAVNRPDMFSSLVTLVDAAPTDPAASTSVIANLGIPNITAMATSASGNGASTAPTAATSSPAPTAAATTPAGTGTGTVSSSTKKGAAPGATALSDVKAGGIVVAIGLAAAALL